MFLQLLRARRRTSMGRYKDMNPQTAVGALECARDGALFECFCVRAPLNGRYPPGPSQNAQPARPTAGSRPRGSFTRSLRSRSRAAAALTRRRKSLAPLPIDQPKEPKLWRVVRRLGLDAHNPYTRRAFSENTARSLRLVRRLGLEDHNPYTRRAFSENTARNSSSVAPSATQASRSARNERR